MILYKTILLSLYKNFTKIQKLRGSVNTPTIFNSSSGDTEFKTYLVVSPFIKLHALIYAHVNKADLKLQPLVNSPLMNFMQMSRQ